MVNYKSYKHLSGDDQAECQRDTDVAGQRNRRSDKKRAQNSANPSDRAAHFSRQLNFLAEFPLPKYK